MVLALSVGSGIGPARADAVRSQLLPPEDGTTTVTVCTPRPKTSPIVVRRADRRDARAIADVGRSVFSASFAHETSEANMKLYLEETYIEQKVAEVLADPSVTAFVAVVEDEIVGFSQMKEGPAESTVSGPNAVELQRLYVIAAYHGGGAANRLVRIALRWAADLDYRTVWLGVSATNFRAQKFYAKFGFTFCGKHTFMIGNDPQTDLLMEGPIVDAVPCGGAPDNPDHI